MARASTKQVKRGVRSHSTSQKVAPTAVWSRNEPAAETIKLGQQLQLLRKRHEWSLADVAEMSGISQSTLSRIENNKLSPTIDILSRLLNGLRIPYHELIIPDGRAAPPDFCQVTRRGAGNRIDLPGLAYEILPGGPEHPRLATTILTVTARSVAEMGGLSSHDGEEFLHVLSGVLILHRRGFEPLVLRTGDSAYFCSGVPHIYVCGSNVPTRILTVSTIDGPSAALHDPRVALAQARRRKAVNDGGTEHGSDTH
jgi:transcriptional regulator with XRE-family HTH domain